MLLQLALIAPGIDGGNTIAALHPEMRSVQRGGVLDGMRWEEVPHTMAIGATYYDHILGGSSYGQRSSASFLWPTASGCTCSGRAHS